jgi:hypothetical protein
MPFDKQGNFTSTPAHTVEAMEIREIDGNVVIRLRGWGLPAKPFTLDGDHEIPEQRAIGSPYTTQQPTGARENVTELTGSWSDYLLGSSPNATADVEVTTATDEFGADGAMVISVSSEPARTARAAAAAVDDLRVRAPLVRVSWAHIVRVGRVKRFVQRWNTPEDLDWDLTFAWIGREEDAEMAPPAATDPAADVRLLESGMSRVFDATAFSIAAVDPTAIEAVDQWMAGIQGAIFELADNVRSRVTGAASSVDVFRRGLGLLGFAAEQANLMALEIESRVAATWIANADPEDLTDVSPSLVVAMLAQKRAAAQAARRLRAAAIRRRFDLIATVEDVVDIYVVRDGEDLQSLARHVYGSAAAWTTLRDFNHLDSGSVPSGTVILVPRSQVQP